MADNRKFLKRPNDGETSDAVAFPDTETAVLAEAAQGRWDRFLQEYLRPCWHEIVMVCRSRHIPLCDADDLFQELSVRLVREGQLRSIPKTTPDTNAELGFRANLPGKYLKYRELSPTSAQFRTYLKSVIRNLMREKVRERMRAPRQALEAEPPELPEVESWLDESVSVSVDRKWLNECLLEAAGRLQSECFAASTRGKRRMYMVLHRSIVEQESAGTTAAHLGVDRTTIADLLTRARGRFIEILQEVTEIDNVAELKTLMSAAPEILLEALKRRPPNEL